MEENKQSVVETVSADLLKDIFAATAQVTPIVEEKPLNEPVIEEIKEIEEKKEIVEEVIKKAKKVSDYSGKLRDLIKHDILENFAITYDGQEVFLEDIEDLTEEGFKEILNGWKTATEEEIKSKYVEVEGLDETTKKLIEIRKAGGDITEIIKSNVTAIDQLKQLQENIENEQVQINIVGHSLQQQGINPKVVQAQIASLIEEGNLETEAKNILDSHLKVHEQEIENKRQAQLERAEKDKEDQKNLRKDLSSEYKKLGLPDNLSKILVDNATKVDQDNITNTDKLYFEAIKKPEDFALLNLFLNNKDKFIEYITSPVVTKTNIENTRKLLTIDIKKTNKPKTSSNSLEEFAEEAARNNNPK